MWAAEALQDFAGDRRGSVMVEFALVSTFFFMTVFGVVEIGYYMWEYASASKGTQAALRYAAVSDPVTRSSATLAPGSNIVISCRMSGDGQSTSCSTGEANHKAMSCIVGTLRGYASFVAPENVVVEYRANDLGVAGVTAPTIAIRLENVAFPAIFLGLLGGRMLPTLDYTITAEDMNSSSPGTDPDNNDTKCEPVT